ncbi:MAG: hypothetical protein AAFQ45_00270 [Pseudomonadota bacterium]
MSVNSIKPVASPFVTGTRGVSGRQLGSAHLAAYGLRGWLGGLRNTDMAQWQAVFETYSGAFGLCHARRTIEALSDWSRAIERSAERDIEICPLSCPTLCQDECVALSIVAAAQADTCPAMQACAFALIGSADIEPVVAGAEAFGAELKSADCIVEPATLAALESCGGANAGPAALQ